jgi:hypothetical protein
MVTSPLAQLFPIHECPDLMADACICDATSNLLFCSIWGRDTAVQELLARLTLGAQENGLERFHLSTELGSLIPVDVGNVDRLKKVTTRALRHTLFGSLVHLWMFDQRCVTPDRANARALALFPKHSPNGIDRLWSLVQDTCPLPLLDHWRDPVMELLNAHQMLTPIEFALGPLEGHQLAIDVPVLTTAMGQLIRNGSLGISNLPPALRRAA